MIHRIDKFWFRALGKVNHWTIRQAHAHCRRERERRFRRLMAKLNSGQNSHLN